MASTNRRKAPRKQLKSVSFAYQSRTFPDHAGNPTTTLVNWSSVPPDRHKLGLHLYPLSPSLRDTPQHIGHELMKLDFRGDARNKWPRVDIYTPQPSLEACMRHHVLEKAHRKAAGQNTNRGPHMVPTWAGGKFDTYRYRNFILVADEDCADWASIQAKGLKVVLFDYRGDPADDIDVVDAEDSGDEEMQWVESYPPAEDPWVLRALVHDGAEKELYEERREAGGKKGEDGLKRVALGSLVYELGCQLPQCCYDGHATCVDCEAGVVHEVCRLEEDGHYIDEESSICVTMRDFYNGLADDVEVMDDEEEEDEKEDENEEEESENTAKGDADRQQAQ